MSERATQSQLDVWFIVSISGLVMIVGIVGLLTWWEHEQRPAEPPVATEARETAWDDSRTRQRPQVPERPRAVPEQRPMEPPSAPASSPGVTLGFDDIETACGDLTSFPNHLCLLNRGSDLVGDGARLVLDEDQASFTGRTTYHNGITIDVAGKERYSLQFGPPKGKPLVPGHYTGAMRWPFNEGPYPGVHVSVGSSGCNTEEGQFRILEIQLSGDKVQRFVADFETTCNRAVGRIAVGEEGAAEGSTIELRRSAPGS